MARIVLGLATSHSPHVSTVPELWHLHAERDRTNPNLDFPELVKNAPAGIEAELTAEIYQRKHEACQRAIAALGNALNETEIDAVIVIGDDQHELFREECIPAFAIFTGADLLDIPPPIETAHPSHLPALWSRHNSFVEKYSMAPDLAKHLTASIVQQGFDVATAAKQYEGRSLGHAYTFVRLRLMGIASSRSFRCSSIATFRPTSHRPIVVFNSARHCAVRLTIGRTICGLPSSPPAG